MPQNITRKCFLLTCVCVCPCVYIYTHTYLGTLSYFLLFVGTLHSDEYIFPFLLCLLLLFSSHLLVRPPQTTILPFCISFPWEWFRLLPPAKCQEPPSILLQAVCLSDLILWNYLSLPLHNHKGFDLGHTWMVFFPAFFNLDLNLEIRSSWSEPQSATGLVFANCIELHLWLKRI